MKIIVLTLLMALTLSPAFCQNALLLLKFEDAEKAFNNGNYEEALRHLNEVEQEAGVTSKTLYLRVVAENQLFDSSRLYEEEAQFNRLKRVRENATKYLNALSGQPIDDKFRTIYRISENLSALPKNKQQWIEGRTAYKKRLEEQKKQQLEAMALARQKAVEQEYIGFLFGRLSIDQLKLNSVARISPVPEAGTATVYIMRPKEGTRDMVQLVLINEGAVKHKLTAGEYIAYHFTPGLLKIGETDAENKRKVRPGAALLMGGVIGLAATSGKTIAKSTEPFGLRLEADKNYYVTSIVTKDKTILYRRIEEAEAKSLLAKLKEVKP